MNLNINLILLYTHSVVIEKNDAVSYKQLLERVEENSELAKFLGWDRCRAFVVGLMCTMAIYIALLNAIYIIVNGKVVEKLCNFQQHTFPKKYFYYFCSLCLLSNMQLFFSHSLVRFVSSLYVKVLVVVYLY